MIKETGLVCKCNNCDAILIDKNPQTDAVEQKLKGTELDMVLLNDGTEDKPDWFWGCPNCLTDGYLDDDVD